MFDLYMITSNYLHHNSYYNYKQTSYLYIVSLPLARHLLYNKSKSAVNLFLNL